MQKSYVHGVPKDDDCLSGDNNSGENKADRMAIVFRHGAYKEYTKDSGQYVPNLLPRLKLQRCFGQMDCLTEGVSYRRSEMLEMGAHRYEQKHSLEAGNPQHFSQKRTSCLIQDISRGRKWQQKGRVRCYHHVRCSGRRVRRGFF